MMDPLHLIEIGEDGTPAENVALTDLARSSCEAVLGVYRQNGFHRPWIGYLAEEDGQVVGMCGFKSPPTDGRVEIAYGESHLINSESMRGRPSIVSPEPLWLSVSLGLWKVDTYFSVRAMASQCHALIHSRAGFG